jgi:hypothetical protein
MTVAQALTPIIWAEVVFAFMSTLLLLMAARREHIGALTERAIVAVVMVIHGAVSAVTIWNNDLGHPFYDAPTGMLMLRLTLAALMAVPVYWTALWFTGRLGDNGKGE